MKALAYSEQHRLAGFESQQEYYTVAECDPERELVLLVQNQKVSIMDKI